MVTTKRTQILSETVRDLRRAIDELRLVPLATSVPLGNATLNITSAIDRINRIISEDER